MVNKLLVLLAMLCPLAPVAAQEIDPGFSPGGQGISLIEKTIASAKTEIEVAAYSFTSPKITNDLLDAHNRGVQVRVLLDKRQTGPHHHPSVEALQAAGIPVRFNDHYAIMHDKYMIIDQKTIETGSFNYTAAAEKRNAENVVVIQDDPAVAQQYLGNWDKLWGGGY